MNLANIQLDNQKRILIVIFCVLIAYVDVSYIIKAQKSGLKNVDVKIARLKKDLANLDKDLENMRLSRAKQGVLQKSQAKQAKILSESQISGLLKDISEQANKLKIEILQIKPARELKAVKAGQPPDKLISYLINLELVCDYHSLGRFINSLENSAVFMTIQEIRITAQIPDYMKQKISLAIKTYVNP